MNDHAQFSPSSLNSIEICPGYRHRPDPDGKKSGAAELGTQIHKALESGQIDTLPDEDSKSLARQCVDFVDSLLAERLPNLPTQDFKERKITIDLGDDLTTFGTLDRLILFGRHGHLLDYKTGKRAVYDAELNLQMWAYTLGVFQKHPELEDITSYIISPARNEVSEHMFERKFMNEMGLRINTVIRRAMEDALDQRNPQADLCVYCARQTSCPALGAKALQIAKKLGPGLVVPSSACVSADRPEDIPHLLRIAPILEKWAEGVRSEALRLNLQEGLEIPGYQRVQRSLPRAVTSVLGTYQAVKDKMPLEEFLAACSKISIVDLEDYFASKAKSKEKAKARKELEDRLKAADVLRESQDIYYLREKKA